MPERKRKPLERRLRRAVPAILIAMLGTYALGLMGTLQKVERLILEAQMAGAPRQSSEIAIVEITDQDFHNIFGGERPLDPEELERLIDAIALSRPAAIGVDIDTSDPRFRELDIDPDWPPVVWEREIYPAGAAYDGDVEPLDVLGGQDPGLNRSSGIPALRDDP
jgi:hypothetical protein